LLEGHGFQVAVDLVSELVDPFLEVGFGDPSLLIACAGLVELGDPFG
jgi:hypothetical protein